MFTSLSLLEWTSDEWALSYPLLFQRAKNSHGKAQATKRLTAWVLHHSGLRRAKALFCHM
jgi:hypothetical protein